MIRYSAPKNWIAYDSMALLKELTEAKAAVMSLQTIPYQRRWVDALQTVQLKREVAGTSRIEGADFTEKELEAAMKESPEQLITRSQKQAHTVAKAYRWIKEIADEKPITNEIICDIHRMIVDGSDDDHCPPGVIRQKDQNVNFGVPRHRGSEGGTECGRDFIRLCEAIHHEFREHDPLIQALALHYHFAAMHPFLDGNGRTARVLEALMLQRAGLRDTLFIAMSNYYYDEKKNYLEALSSVRAKEHDLTPFLLFGLKGVALQCQRLFNEIRTQVARSLFRNLMLDLFNRLKNPRKRVIAQRQVEILKLLLERDEMKLDELQRATDGFYQKLNNSRKALIRDINDLIRLEALSAKQLPSKEWLIVIRLDWPMRITETSFFEQLQKLPTAKADGVLCQTNMAFQKPEYSVSI